MFSLITENFVAKFQLLHSQKAVNQYVPSKPGSICLKLYILSFIPRSCAMTLGSPGRKNHIVYFTSSVCSSLPRLAIGAAITNPSSQPVVVIVRTADWPQLSPKCFNPKAPLHQSHDAHKTTGHHSVNTQV